jgi:hypothetical protein
MEDWIPCHHQHLHFHFSLNTTNDVAKFDPNLWPYNPQTCKFSGNNL